MSLHTQKNALKIIFKMASGKRVKPLITLPPTKTFLPESLIDSVRMERTSPESVGEDSAHINAFFETLSGQSDVYPHGVVIAKDGKVIAEKSFEPYSNDIPHVSYSMCKTVVGLAIGTLIDDKKLKLTDKITDVLKESVYGYRRHKRYKELTIRHLLTMTARVNYKEEGMVSDVDWVKGYFSSYVMKKKEFSYNSMNTFILGVVVKEVSGKGLFEYVQEKIFNPLGIRKVFWEKNGQGLEKGGWGLYITPEDMAKLGVLVLNEGEYQGKRIVSKEYVREMVLPHARTPDYIGGYNYGYQIWTAKKYSAYCFNGMFGQNIVIFPERKLVVAITSGNNDLFFSNAIFSILKSYFVDGEEKDVSSEKEKAIPCNISKDVFGEYVLHEERGFAGLFPVMMQVIFNNFTSGVRGIALNKKDSVIELCVREDEEYKLYLNSDGSYNYFDLNVSGNLFRVASRAKSEKKNDKTFLSVELYFVEQASVRYIDFIFDGDNVHVTWHENPGARFILGIFRIVKRAVNAHNLPGRLINHDFFFVLKQANKVFSPESKGRKLK